MAECGPGCELGWVDIEPLLSEETLDAIWEEAGDEMTRRYLLNKEHCQRVLDPRYSNDFVTGSARTRLDGQRTALYLIRVGEMYKIGISKYPESRLKQIQTGSHLTAEILELLWLPSGALARRAEAGIHKNLAEFRVRGEWFDLKEQPSLEALVEALCEEPS